MEVSPIHPIITVRGRVLYLVVVRYHIGAEVVLATSQSISPQYIHNKG